MRFGVWDHMPQRPSQSTADLYREHLAQIEAAEALGLGEYWLAEHHFSPGYSCLPAPNLILAAAAARTRRLRFGVLINVVPFHHPLRLVEEINVLDQLSGGRMMLGLGRGMRASEYEQFAISLEESHGRFFEALDLIVASLSGEPVTFEGRYYRCRGARVAPRSVQEPRVPVVLASSSNPRSAEYAARHGMRLAQGLGADADLVATLGRYHAVRAELGGEAGPPDLTLMRMTCVAPTDEEAVAVARPALFDLFRSFSGDPDPRFAQPTQAAFRHHTGASLGGRLGALSFEELVDSGFVLVGGPDRVAATIRNLEGRFRMDCLLAAFNFGGLPHGVMMRSQELYAREVVPRLATAVAAAS